MLHATKRQSPAERRSMAMALARKNMTTLTVRRPFRPVLQKSWLYSLDARFRCLSYLQYSESLGAVRAWLRGLTSELGRPDYVVIARRPLGEIYARWDLVLCSGRPDASALEILEQPSEMEAA